MVLGRAGEAPVPAAPCIMYRLDNYVPQDHPRITIDDTLQTVHADATPLEYVIEWIGGDAMAAAARALALLHATQRTVDLFRVCGLMGASNPQDLTALELGTMRARVQVRLTLNASLTSTAAPETIEHQDARVRSTAPVFDKTFTIDQGVNPNG
jgi:hypothetical protein